MTRDASPAVPLTGGLATAVHGDELYVSNGVDYRVDVYTTQGEHVRSIRSDRPAPVFDAASRTAYVDRMVASVANMQGDEAAERRRPQIEDNVPDTLPAFSQMMIDPAGRLWLLSTTIAGVDDRPRTATVLDADGSFLGDVELPAGFRPFQVGEDWILGVTSDELDVNRVVVHGLSKP